MMRRSRAGLAAVGVSITLVSTPLAAATTQPGSLGPGDWWYAAMGIDELHEHGTGEGIVVAIVDSPIDATVPELDGVDLLSSESFCQLGGDPRPSTIEGPDADHATAMTALIAGNGRGTGPGGAGVRGVAPDAQLRHYAALYYEGDGQEAAREGGMVCNMGGGYNWSGHRSVPAAITQAAEDGADIINVSISTQHGLDYAEAVLAAQRHNAIVVTAVAGDGSMIWPAENNGVVVVNSVRQDTAISDRGGLDRPNEITDLAAPGEAIAGGGFQNGVWDSAKVTNGSSNAAAIVSGGLAALWSAHPNATANQIVQAAITYTGVRADGDNWHHDFRRAADAPTAGGKSEHHGYGIFAPADAVLIDPTTLPDEMPLYRDRFTFTPSIEEINAALAERSPEDSPAVRMGLVTSEPTVTQTPTATAAGTTETPTTESPTTESPTTEPTTEPTAVSPADESATGSALWIAGAGALAVVLLLGLLALRRRAPARTDAQSPTADPQTADQQTADPKTADPQRADPQGGTPQ